MGIALLWKPRPFKRLWCWNISIVYAVLPLWINRGHDDVIKCKHFPYFWNFVWGIHRWPVISRTKASDAEIWCFPLICVWNNNWVNTGDAGDLRRHRAHYDVTVMYKFKTFKPYDKHCCQYQPTKFWIIKLIWFIDLDSHTELSAYKKEMSIKPIEKTW